MPTCQTEGCTGGWICDETTEICRECTTNDECAAQYTTEGFLRCEQGACVTYSCSAPELPDPFPAASPYSGWPNPRLDADRQLIVQYLDSPMRLFPLGIEGISMDKMDEAKEAGFTFIKANTACCSVTSLDEQLNYLRKGNAEGLYVVLKPFDPPWQVEDPYDAFCFAGSKRPCLSGQPVVALVARVRAPICGF